MPVKDFGGGGGSNFIFEKSILQRLSPGHSPRVQRMLSVHYVPHKQNILNLQRPLKFWLEFSLLGWQTTGVSQTQFSCVCFKVLKFKHASLSVIVKYAGLDCGGQSPLSVSSLFRSLKSTCLNSIAQKSGHDSFAIDRNAVSQLILHT